MYHYNIPKDRRAVLCPKDMRAMARLPETVNTNDFGVFARASFPIGSSLQLLLLLRIRLYSVRTSRRRRSVDPSDCSTRLLLLYTYRVRGLSLAAPSR